MKTKKVQDKSNAELVAKLKFFFDNNIVVERPRDMWRVDYAALLKALAPDSVAVDLALGKGGKSLNHYVYSDNVHHGVSELHAYFHSEAKDIRELRATDTSALFILQDYLDRHRTRAIKFIEYAEWMMAEHGELCKLTDNEWKHSVLAMALAVTEECPVNMHMHAVPTFSGLKCPEVLRWLSYVAGMYPVDRYVFDRTHNYDTHAALALFKALDAYPPLLAEMLVIKARSVFKYPLGVEHEHWENQHRAAVSQTAHLNHCDLEGVADNIVDSVNSIIEGYELHGSYYCLEQSIFPTLVY